MQDFRRLRIWQEGQRFAANVFWVTRRMRDAGSLRHQLRSAAQSVPANIAEGSRRRTPAEFANFLQTSIASASECESHLDLMLRCQLLSPRQGRALIEHIVSIRRQTIAFRKRVVAAVPPTPTPRKPNNPQPPTDRLGAGG